MEPFKPFEIRPVLFQSGKKRPSYEQQQCNGYKCIVAFLTHTKYKCSKLGYYKKSLFTPLMEECQKLFYYIDICCYSNHYSPYKGSGLVGKASVLGARCLVLPGFEPHLQHTFFLYFNHTVLQVKRSNSIILIAINTLDVSMNVLVGFQQC